MHFADLVEEPAEYEIKFAATEPWQQDSRTHVQRYAHGLIDGEAPCAGHGHASSQTNSRQDCAIETQNAGIVAPVATVPVPNTATVKSLRVQVLLSTPGGEALRVKHRAFSQLCIWELAKHASKTLVLWSVCSKPTCDSASNYSYRTAMSTGSLPAQRQVLTSKNWAKLKTQYADIQSKEIAAHCTSAGADCTSAGAVL